MSESHFLFQNYSKTGCHCKWFKPRSISSYSVIVQVRVVQKRNVVGDGCFDNLSGSHLQSQVNSVCQAMML